MPSCHHKIFYEAVVCFFFLSFFLSSHTFSGACGSFREPRKFFSNSLFIHSLVCLITQLISSWISAKFVSTLLLCMLYLSYYYQSEVNTLMYLRTITLQVDSCHNLDPPSNDLHKFSDTQSIWMYHSVVKVLKKSQA